MPRFHEPRFPLTVAAARAGTSLAQLRADIADGLCEASFATDGHGRQCAGNVSQSELRRYRAETVTHRAQQVAAKLAAEERVKIEAEREHEHGLLRERLARAKGRR